MPACSGILCVGDVLSGGLPLLRLVAGTNSSVTRTSLSLFILGIFCQIFGMNRLFILLFLCLTLLVSSILYPGSNQAVAGKYSYEDNDDSLELLIDRAKKGDSSAQNDLGMCYRSGVKKVTRARNTFWVGVTLAEKVSCRTIRLR